MLFSKRAAAEQKARSPTVRSLVLEEQTVGRSEGVGGGFCGVISSCR